MKPPRGAPRRNATVPVGLRIIGGVFRGRKLEYSGDLRTRPMKDRVREALFNLLGPAVQGKVAIDLFAGTGALGLEALSRGALHAVFVERHLPTARLISRNAAALGVEAAVTVDSADAFLWARRFRDPSAKSWIVFCSPPYEFYLSKKNDMLELLTGLMLRSPPQSLFAVEFDGRFDFRDLPTAEQWDVREYLPAILGIWEKSGSS
jgi:16S rRNA (guanine966-N2)-methyltransferase